MKDPAAVDELLRRYRLKSLKELDKLAKEGDGSAAYEASKCRNAGYRHDAEVPVKPSDLSALDRMKARLSSLKRALPLAKQGSEGGTLGVAETDLRVDQPEIKGGSPKTGSKPDPTYKPKSTYGSAQGHAEQNLVGALKRAILRAKLTGAQMIGKKVYMLIEQEVCETCKSGLYSESAGAGVLNQFSAEYS